MHNSNLGEEVFFPVHKNVLFMQFYILISIEIAQVATAIQYEGFPWAAVCVETFFYYYSHWWLTGMTTAPF